MNHDFDLPCSVAAWPIESMKLAMHSFPRRALFLLLLLLQLSSLFGLPVALHSRLREHRTLLQSQSTLVQASRHDSEEVTTINCDFLTPEMTTLRQLRDGLRVYLSGKPHRACEWTEKDETGSKSVVTPNDFTYQLDAHDRVVSAHGTVSKLVDRDDYDAAVRCYADRVAQHDHFAVEYDVGHVLRATWGSSACAPVNYFPQARISNQSASIAPFFSHSLSLFMNLLGVVVVVVHSSALFHCRWWPLVSDGVDRQSTC